MQKGLPDFVDFWANLFALFRLFEIINFVSFKRLNFVDLVTFSPFSWTCSDALNYVAKQIFCQKKTDNIHHGLVTNVNRRQKIVNLLTLTNFKNTIEKRAKEIMEMSPENMQQPFLVSFGQNIFNFIVTLK